MAEYTVNTTHEDYQEWLPLAKKCRTVEEGEEAIKEHRNVYLPVPTSMKTNPDFYKTYIDRAVFFNVTGKTKSNYAGAILRRDPKLLVSETVGGLLNDSTLANETIYDLIRESVNEIINPGRFAVLVDYDNVNQRPKLSTYCGENIINWFESTVNGKYQLSMAVLKEENYEQNPANPFEVYETCSFRVLFLNMDGIYAQRVYSSGDAKWDEYDYEIIPTINGVPLTQIPITFFNPSNNEVEPEEPLLLDVVNMNLSHFKTTAELEHALYWSAMPTPVITGLTSAPERPLVIGSTEAWVLSNKDAKVEIMEFSGASVNAISDALKAKEDKLSALGTRLLDPKGNETARAASIRQGAETATLIDVVNSLENGWDRVLSLFSLWVGEVQSGKLISFNRDFTDNKITESEMTAYINAWEKGAISNETLVNTLIDGEVVDPMTDVQAEVQRLDNFRKPVTV